MHQAAKGCVTGAGPSKSAQERAFQDKKEYILPLRLDDTPVPGIRATTGFIDLRKIGIEEVAKLTITKVKAAKATKAMSTGTTKPAPKARAEKAARAAKKPATAVELSSNLQIKQKFTDHDRDAFLDKAFETISKFFKGSLTALQTKNKHIVGKFRKINNNHFTAVIYRDGDSVSECGIRLDGGAGWGGKRIAYSTQPESTNSMNDWVSAENDGQTLFLKGNGFTAVMAVGGAKDKLAPKDAAERFWARLMEPLQR